MNLKAHLGCWNRVIPGFINVDLCDLPHIDYKSSIDKLPFFANESVDLIYCSHALEYFDRDQALIALKEWWRVLSPGGVLRLAVPNFEALIQVYDITKDLSKIIGPMYGKMNVSTQKGNNTLYHRTIYDERSLKNLLIECGFTNPTIWNWRYTEHAHIDDHSQAYYPHMQKNDGLLVSLNMQAIKEI